METFLIAGLGNPDKKYEETRHNAGFKAIDRLAQKLNIKIDEKKFKGLFGSTVVGGRKLLLLKPQTYMNLSGESVAVAAGFFKVPAEHIIILFDDVNFDCGRMRIRGGGSAGGHNGMKNIIAMLGTDAFPRVRIGVGDKSSRDMISHVLGRFEEKDRRIMDKIYNEAADAAMCIIENGTAEAMNRYNGLDLTEKPAAQPETKPEIKPEAKPETKPEAKEAETDRGV